LTRFPSLKCRIKNDQALGLTGKRHHKTAVQICLRWLLQQNVAAIPRTSNLISAIGSANGRLTDCGFAPKWD
jgi:2,5-diketo-D-gluconate reductase B